MGKTKGNKSEGVTLTQSVSDRWGELNLKMSAQDGTCSEGNAQQGYPSLCKNGCGFFSSVDSKGFCSVCYKDFLKKEQSSTEATEEVAATTASLSNLNVSVEESEAASSPAAAAAESSEPEVVDGAAAKSVLGQAAVSEPPEKEPLRLLQEEGWPHRICLQVRRDVLWHPQIQRQAQLHLQLRRPRQVRDRRSQPSDCGREGRQNLNQQLA